MRNVCTEAGMFWGNNSTIAETFLHFFGSFTCYPKFSHRNADVCGNKPYARTGLQFPLAIGGVVIYGRRRLRSGPSITPIETGETSEDPKSFEKFRL